MDYKPKNRESLSISSRIDSIEGILYPNDKKITLPNHNKISLFDFWYTACLPCKKSIPELNKLYEKYKGKVDFWGVNPYPDDKKNPEKMQSFLAKTPINYPIVFASWENISHLQINSFPTVYIVDKKGILIFSLNGYDEEMNFFSTIDEVISELLTDK